MLLTCDIGNTNIKLAVYDDDSQLTFSMLNSDLIDFKSFILSFLYKANIRETQINDSIVASVVPNLTEPVVQALRLITGRNPFVIDGHYHFGVAIDPEIKEEVGADLLVMCAYAFQKFQREVLVVSLGTATVVCHVTEEGKLKHCIIAPGFEKMSSTLYSSAARLPEFTPKKQDSYLASNTIDAMSVGVFEGFIGMVSHLIAGIKHDLHKDDIMVVGCGGSGKEIAPYIKELSLYEPDMVTIGLSFIYNRYIKHV